MEYAVLFLPLLGSIIGYFGRSLGNFFSELATSFFVCASAILSAAIFYNGINTNSYGNFIIFEWVSSGGAPMSAYKFLLQWNRDSNEPIVPKTLGGSGSVAHI